MQSLTLLPALQELPGGDDGTHKPFHDHITGLVSMDRAMDAAEFASATSFGLWVIFDDINVDDTIAAAYSASPMYRDEASLHDHWQEMMERGDKSMEGFNNGLKGKVAEIDAKDLLEAEGNSGVTMHPEPNNEGWDISAIDPNGQDVLIQVKTGGSDIQYYDTLEAMRESDYPFVLGSKLHERISEKAPELADRIIADIGPDLELVDGITDGLTTLSDNMGVDIPDGVVDIIPYAAAIIAGARLIGSVLKTEKEFKAADRTTKNRIQVVQTLTLMSRMGVTSVLATAGGMGGGTIGSAVPGVGNLVGGIVGSMGGAGLGIYLNRHLQPHMLNLALNITNLTNEDLFYCKDKPRIDNVALTFRTTASELTASPNAAALPAPA